MDVYCAGEEVKSLAASLKDKGKSQGQGQLFQIQFAAPTCAAGIANYNLTTSSGNVLLDLGGIKTLSFTFKGTVTYTHNPKP